jgi:hypothetical protein
MEIGESYGVQLLPVTIGGLVLLAYTAMAVALAAIVTPRRDVL